MLKVKLLNGDYVTVTGEESVSIPGTFEEVSFGAAFIWGSIDPLFIKISDNEAVRRSESDRVPVKVYHFAKNCKVND